MAEKFKYIVRVANTDLDGNKPIGHALLKIKGIKYMYSNAVCKIAKIDYRKKTGELSAAEVDKINDVITKPMMYDIPTFLQNRNKDYETGDSTHFIGSDLDYAKINDVKRMQKIKSYRGMRHAAKLPVRGQRTKSNFRKGKSLGVSKKGKKA